MNHPSGVRAARVDQERATAPAGTINRGAKMRERRTARPGRGRPGPDLVDVRSVTDRECRARGRAARVRRPPRHNTYVAAVTADARQPMAWTAGCA
jgi:hypothetical protein